MTTFLKNITLVAQSAALFRDEALISAGVTGYQARYLLGVHNRPGISQEGLAARLMVNKSNVARQLAALEEGGYLRREQSSEDKRVMLVYTTPEGEALIPAIREANAKWRGVLCKGLSDEEVEQLSRMLDVMVKNAKEYQGTENA